MQLRVVRGGFRGCYRGTVDFGDGPRTNGGGGGDFFVASYTRELHFRWALTGQTTGTSDVRDIAVEADGTLFAGGLIAGTSTRLGGSIDAGGRQDVLLFSVEGGGAVRWAQHWQESERDNHQGREVALRRMAGCSLRAPTTRSTSGRAR